MTGWIQKKLAISGKRRGFHLITNGKLIKLKLEIETQLPEIKLISVGLLHLLLQHTSAGLTLNENCDPEVRSDLNDVLNNLIPEGNFYAHSDEGPDDMPAHVKNSLMGVNLTLPISQGKLALG